MSKTPYSQRTDLEKVSSNWTKSQGLFARREYSLSIVRAAVTAELAINYAIRQELHIKHKLPIQFVEKQLKLANGIRGKLDRLYLPILEGTPLKRKASDISKSLEILNKQRNNIAHRGEFRKKETAQQQMELAEKEISKLIKIYNPEFTLEKFNPKKTMTREWQLPTGSVVSMPHFPDEGDD